MSGVNVASDEEVDLAGLAARRAEAAEGRLRAEVAGRLVRQGKPPFVNARPIHDPVRIEPVTRLQIPIAHHLFRKVTSGTQDLYAEQGLSGRCQMGLAVVRG